MIERSDFLFAKPSFLDGAARIFDLGSTLNEYNGSPSAEQADDAALRGDWEVVGSDLRWAVDRFSQDVERALPGVAPQ